MVVGASQCKAPGGFREMLRIFSRICITFFLFLIVCVIVYSLEVHQGEGAEIEFGTNISGRSHDGKCSDPRFTGNPKSSKSGMAERVYLEDIFGDATDCYKAYKEESIYLMEKIDNIDFGDDPVEGSRDYECHDTRFVTGENVPLSTEGKEGLGEIRKDASDCRLAYLTEEIWMRDREHGIVFGNDRGSWPRDDECDDPRFRNRPGHKVMADSPSAKNVRHDATDCRRFFHEEKITLRPTEAKDGIVFGNDTGRWPFDGECDDPRFENHPDNLESSMSSSFIKESVERDATDCRDAYDRGTIIFTEIQIIDGIQFGDDTSEWAYDGECDDPRFRDFPVTSGSDDTPSRPTNHSEWGHDATDCFRAYRDEKVQLIPKAGKN